MDVASVHFFCYIFFDSYLDRIALINLSFRLSALAFCSDKTAQTAAGIQPINVICKIKQIIPVIILPRSKNDINGKKIAIKVIVKS